LRVVSKFTRLWMLTWALLLAGSGNQATHWGLRGGYVIELPCRAIHASIVLFHHSGFENSCQICSIGQRKMDHHQRLSLIYMATYHQITRLWFYLKVKLDQCMAHKAKCNKSDTLGVICLQSWKLRLGLSLAHISPCIHLKHLISLHMRLIAKMLPWLASQLEVDFDLTLTCSLLTWLGWTWLGGNTNFHVNFTHSLFPRAQAQRAEGVSKAGTNIRWLSPL
jgi:hypothetical protein